MSLLVAFCLLACDHDDTDKTLIATSDQVTTARGIAVTVDVLGSDTDSSGNELILADVTQAMHGTVTINTDDTVTYIPVPDFDGSDSFSYTLSNARGSSANAIVTVTVLPECDTFTQIDVPGATDTRANGINNASQVVGTFTDAHGTHGFLMVNDTFSRFDIPNTVTTRGSGINNLGQIVGSFQVRQDPPETGFFTRGYVATPMGHNPYVTYK